MNINESFSSNNFSAYPLNENMDAIEAMHVLEEEDPIPVPSEKIFDVLVLLNDGVGNPIFSTIIMELFKKVSHVFNEVADNIETMESDGTTMKVQLKDTLRIWAGNLANSTDGAILEISKKLAVTYSKATETSNTKITFNHSADSKGVAVVKSLLPFSINIKEIEIKKNKDGEDFLSVTPCLLIWNIFTQNYIEASPPKIIDIGEPVEKFMGFLRRDWTVDCGLIPATMGDCQAAKRHLSAPTLSK